MTQNLLLFKQNAPVNDNYKQRNSFVDDAYNAILDLLYLMEQVANESTAEKRAVVNVIDDIMQRCNKFLEDI